MGDIMIHVLANHEELLQFATFNLHAFLLYPNKESTENKFKNSFIVLFFKINENIADNEQ